MHKPVLCNCCGLHEVICGCTPEKVIRQGEKMMEEFAREQSTGSWTLAELANHLRGMGYKVEKSKPNPKKRKKLRKR